MRERGLIFVTKGPGRYRPCRYEINQALLRGDKFDTPESVVRGDRLDASGVTELSPKSLKRQELKEGGSSASSSFSEVEPQTDEERADAVVAFATERVVSQTKASARFPLLAIQAMQPLLPRS